MLMRTAGLFTQISSPRSIRPSMLRNSWSSWWKRCPRISEQMTFDTALLTSGARFTPVAGDFSLSCSSSVLTVARPSWMQGSKLSLPRPNFRNFFPNLLRMKEGTRKKPKFPTSGHGGGPGGMLARCRRRF
ncbi:hypothetical protein EYF80_000002 [Liparis tanakae]|uniref:Uncharacterized protein n=1 Tax=Liparis tanakae TaxID=230148 RepID=A0A4Z2JGI5_9TELE|nr:hypothetical protein EYF80_000002 [Liparis tanakae]